MKVIAFNGSARKEGVTAALLKLALQPIAAAGIETELIHLGNEALRGCTACYGCFKTLDKQCSVKNDVMNGYIDKMMAADGILIGSPTYFADVSTNIKALIERTGMVARANGDMFRRKVGAAVIAVRRAGAIHAFDSINHFFLIGQMIVPGSCYWNVAVVGRDVSQLDKDPEGLHTMEVLGQNVAWLLKKLA